MQAWSSRQEWSLSNCELTVHVGLRQNGANALSVQRRAYLRAKLGDLSDTGSVVTSIPVSVANDAWTERQ